MKFVKGRYVLTLIFLLAFIVRLMVVLQGNPIPVGDAYVYDGLAVSISQGNGYVNNNGSPHSLYPPFYPFFLSIIYTFFGHSYFAVKVIQSMIGAFSCVLIYLIGKKAIGAAAGGIAAFISIFYLPFVKSAGLLLTELLFTFLLCLIVFYLLKIQEKMKFKNCIILGLLLGIASLTKSVMVLFPFFAMPVFVYLREKGFLDRLKGYIVVLLFFSLSIAPWIVRNYNVYDGFVLTSAGGGLGLYSSYCPGGGGIFGFIAAPDDSVVVEANRISSPVLRSHFFIKKTFEFIANNPKKVFVLELKKILYLWAPFDWEIVGGRWFNFVYVAMLPFFVLGIIMSFKQLIRIFTILLPIIYFQIMTLIFYGSPRFRLPIEPFLFILAVSGILQSWRWIFVKRVSN